MEKEKLSKIPKLIPSQFDDYIFSNWKPKVSGFYEQFHIERIENYRTHLKLPLQPHRRSVYFFLYLTKGKSMRRKGLTQYEILPNQIFFLPADQITSLDEVEEATEGFYCHFQPEIFHFLKLKVDLANDFHFFNLTSEPVVNVSDPERINVLLQILEKEYRRNEQNRFELIPLYLLALLKEIVCFSEPIANMPKNAANFITQRYKNALASQIYEKKTVQEFADYLAVSPNHLHKCVKITTGKSAHELLEDMRILEAKVLLKQTNLSVGEIAYKIGKFEPSDFTRFFKSKTGITPVKYRKQL